MRRSQAFAVLVLALLMLAVVPLQPAGAQTSYSEKLNVDIAGSNALWYYTFQGINGTSSLSGLESAPGLSWYNITAMKTSGWTADYQAFGPRGYNVFPVSTPPEEGVLLRVGSDSYADAFAAASAAGAYLLTQFVSSANGTGSYSFYAPLTFNTVVPKTLFPLVPTGEGGFAAAVNPTGFESTTSPFVILEGTKSSPGFSRTLIVGSITGGALDANSRINILSLYGTTVASISAGAHSTSSAIQVRVLDGLTRSKDHASIFNDTVNFASSYTLTLPASKKVTSLNATVLQHPPQLVAYRTISSGVLHSGQKLAVTLTFTNLSPSISVNGVTFTDNWWNSTAGFTLDHGNYSVPSTIVGGATVTPVYVLKYNGNGTGKLTIPAGVVRYSYQYGTGIAFRGEAALNPVTFYLGGSEAVVYSYAVPTGGYGKSVGSLQNIAVRAVNVGNQPASSVVVAGQSISGLAINGSSTVTVTLSAQGLTGTNATDSYATTYQDLAGNKLQATSNVVTEIFSHTNMKLGLAVVTVSETSAPFKGAGTNLTMAFVVANKGSGNVTSFSGQTPLPAGLPCGAVKGNGTTCSGGVVTLSFSRIAPLKTLKSFMFFNVSKPQDFIFRSIMFQGVTGGINVQGASNPVGIPTGALVTKSFVPAQLFGGMTSTVSLVASNAGPYTLYNMTFGSAADSFDVIPVSTLTSKTAPTIAAKSNSTLTYAVKALPTQGNLSSLASMAIFYFGGTQISLSFPGPKVAIYEPLYASITTNPTSTTEGKPFTLAITLTNPSGVAVTNVRFSLPIPSGLALSQPMGANMVGKNFTIQAPSLGPHGILVANATVQASSGITVPFAKASLSFAYGGVTVMGTVPTGGIAIGENVTARYVLPIALVLVVLLAMVYYLRKISHPSVPTSRQ